MSILERWENALLDKYLDSVDCKCGEECIESWGECCGDCPSCERYDEPEGNDDPHWENAKW